MSCYTHKMAIISRPSSVYFVTPLLPIYSYRYVRIIQFSKLFSTGLLFVDEKSRLNGLKQQKNTSCGTKFDKRKIEKHTEIVRRMLKHVIHSYKLSNAPT